MKGTATTGRAVAIANNDYVHLAWDFGPKPLPNCIGFSVHRIADGNPPVEKPLLVYDGYSEQGGNRVTRSVSSDTKPITKYGWRDVHVPRGGTFRYRIIPMQRSPGGAAVPLAGTTSLTTDSVTISPNCGELTVFFNRGLLATQRATTLLWDAKTGKPTLDTIEKLINDPTSDLRASLSGQLFEALTSLLRRAATEGGACWASLFELTDDELIKELCACNELHLILSNNNEEPDPDVPDSKAIYDGKNQKAAQALRASIRPGKTLEFLRRYMPSGRIGHNKFMVYCDANKVPRAVLTGSTNWTPSGLCTQSNNAIILQSQEIAQQYLDYWNLLKADATVVASTSPPAPLRPIQKPELRSNCATPRPVSNVSNSVSVRVWFSPNTTSPAQSGRARAASPSPTPVDLSEVYGAVRGARQSILFLAFMPGKAGSPGSAHILKELASLAKARPALFIRGAVSDPSLADELDQTRFDGPVPPDLEVVSPRGVFLDWDAWQREIYRYGHAIVHDKIVVVDPFSPQCVVVTGSHNLGSRASSNNDENLMVIRGSPAVASAYAVHVMDVFEHYRGRMIAYQKALQKAMEEVQRTTGKRDRKAAAKLVWKYYDIADFKEYDDAWQDRYFDPSSYSCLERQFWTSGGTPLPALVPRKRTGAKRQQSG